MMKLEKRAEIILNKLGVVDYTTGMKLFEKENRSLLQSNAFEGFSLHAFLNKKYFEYDSSPLLTELVETTFEMTDAEMFEYLLDYSGLRNEGNSFTAPGRLYHDWSPAHENGVTITYSFETNEYSILPVSDEYELITRPLAPFIEQIMRSVRARLLHNPSIFAGEEVEKAVIASFGYYAGTYL